MEEKTIEVTDKNGNIFYINPEDIQQMIYKSTGSTEKSEKTVITFKNGVVIKVMEDIDEIRARSQK